MGISVEITAVNPPEIMASRAVETGEKLELTIYKGAYSGKRKA
ncbi:MULTISPECIES: hypothetical protein [unclassified Methanosarcina]|nr:MULTISPECIES: hypothetical protein [unclassified Methanosarcina]